MRGNAELSAWGGEVLAGAAATVVGSEHIRHVVREVCGTVERVHEIPPGVDVELWRPAPKADALAGLLAEARLDPPNPGSASERLPDEGNVLRLAEFLEGDRPTVVYYGKLIENKGVQVLLEALRGLEARAVIVGFGDYRDELERMAEGLDVLFTGPLEHRHLVHLLALADVAVVPSIFPEAFGMVAAEAAAAGCPPVVAESLGPGRGRARTGGGLPAGPQRARELPERRRRCAPLAPRRRARPARRRARGASRCGPHGGGRALELDERRRAHPRPRRIVLVARTLRLPMADVPNSDPRVERRARRRRPFAAVGLSRRSSRSRSFHPSRPWPSSAARVTPRPSRSRPSR